MRSTPIIYLRDKFSIKPGLVGRYFEGKENLLKALEGTGVSLIAACGGRTLIQGEPVPEVLPPMMHIWQLPHWDTLYDLMYEFSEQEWYAREISSLRIEHQDLLIKIGPGIEPTPRPRWSEDGHSEAVYLYDEIRLNVATTKVEHLHDLNWFKAVVETERRWKLRWIASEVTGTPGQLCLLWEIPSIKDIENTVAYFAYNRNKRVSDRYSNMMAGIETLNRKYMFPESTEELDDRIPNPKPENSLSRLELAKRLMAIRGTERSGAQAPLGVAGPQVTNEYK